MKHLLTLTLLCIGLTAFAQANSDPLPEKVARIDTTVTKMGKLLNILSEFRLVAYAQTQWQMADTAGARSVAGGDFPVAANNRFSIRRGRVKIGFDHEGKKGFRVFQLQFQMDMSERGFQARDFFGRVIDPWTGWVGIQAGMMDRPFGYEVRTADDWRETPERGRMSQIIFPSEKDLGASLVIENPKTFKLFNIRLDAGMFNGTGGAAGAFAGRKDFIGSIKASKTIGSATKFTLSGGASLYYGSELQQHSVFDLEPNALGALVYTKESDTINANKLYFSRRAAGVDLQASIDYHIGTTTLRGEFIAGQEPGTVNTDVAPVTEPNPPIDLYIRKFNGAYFYFVQTFKHKVKGQNMSHEIVVKYDWFNPNTQVAQKGLSTTNDARVSFADVKYQTIGFGYNFKPTDYFMLMLYYDYVMNAKSNIKGFTSDLKDNVFTVRLQFKLDTDWFNKKVRESKF